MTNLEWALQALLVLALGAALPGAVRLERALSALGRDRADLTASARQLTDAVSEAEAAMARLRGSADRAGRSMAEQVAAAGRVGKDLQFLLERAEAEADRLDLAIRGRRAPREMTLAEAKPTVDPAEASAARARAEEGVLRVFRSAAP